MKRIFTFIILIFLIMPYEMANGETYNQQEGSISVYVDNNRITYYETLNNLRRITDEKIIRFIPLSDGEELEIKGLRGRGKEVYVLTEDNNGGDFYEIKKDEKGAYVYINFKNYYEVESITMEYIKKVKPIKGTDITFVKDNAYDNRKNTIKLEKINFNVNIQGGESGVWKKGIEDDVITKSGRDYNIESVIGEDESFEYAIGYSLEMNIYSNIKSDNNEYLTELTSQYGENITKSEDVKIEKGDYYEGTTFNVTAIAMIVVIILAIPTIIVLIIRKIKNRNSIENLNRVKMVKDVPNTIDMKTVAMAFNCSKNRVIALLLIELIEEDNIEVKTNGLLVKNINWKDSSEKKKLFYALEENCINSMISYDRLKKFFNGVECEEIYNEVKSEFEDNFKVDSKGKYSNIDIDSLKGFKKYLMECKGEELENNKLKDLILMAKYYIALNIRECGQEVYVLLNPNTLKGITMFRNLLITIGDRYFIDYLLEDIIKAGEQ